MKIEVRKVGDLKILVGMAGNLVVSGTKTNGISLSNTTLLAEVK